MKLLGVIRLAHLTIARSLNFFLVNALILAGLLGLGLACFYFSLTSGFNTVSFLLYPLLALLFYLYAAAAQVQYYGPRLREEASLPGLKEAWRAAKKQWLSLVMMAVVVTVIGLFFSSLPGLWAALYRKLLPLKASVPVTFEEIKNIPLAAIIQPRYLLYLIFSLISLLLLFLVLPLFALGFTAAARGEGFKAELKKLKTYFRAKPCSSTLLYLFSLAIIILLPSRIISLPGLTSIPGVDVIFLGLQFLIAFFIFVYGMLMALLCQMILQEMAAQENIPK